MNITRPQMDLLKTIAGCINGDAACQKKLYYEYYSFAMGICLRYARSQEEAQEIVNDGFCKVFSKLEDCTHFSSFQGWVRKIMVNTAIDHHRKFEKHYHTVDVSYVRQEMISPDVLSSFGHEVILQAIQELAPSYRMVFNLYVVDGYSHDEIGEMLSITAGTSRSHLNIARCKLMKKLTGQFETKNQSV